MVQKILRNNGLVPGKITYRPDLAENAVLEAKINGAKIIKGDSVYKGSTVDIVVGDGRGTTRFLMPELKGLTVEEAEYTILGSGLVIGPLIYQESDTLEDGMIIKSLPLIKLSEKDKSYYRNTNSDEGLTFYDRLMLISTNPDSIYSCLRLSSNYIIATSQYYNALINGKQYIDITKLDFIQ